jgi:hypothetical protein
MLFGAGYTEQPSPLTSPKTHTWDEASLLGASVC